MFFHGSGGSENVELKPVWYNVEGSKQTKSQTVLPVFFFFYFTKKPLLSGKSGFNLKTIYYA